MSDTTLEILNIEDFDSRRSLPVDIAEGAALDATKLIKPGMALGLDVGTGFYKRVTTTDQPFFLAYVAGDRLDVKTAGSVTGVKPQDLVYLDSANVVVGTPTAGQYLKLALGGSNDGKFEVEDPVDTVAKTLLVKARVVKAAGADGKLLVQFEKFN
jgi:hypothetical protein